MSRNRTLNTTTVRMAEHVDGSLYENLYLLSLKIPMSKELKAHMKKDILRIPNSTAFFQVAYYLMTAVDASYITPELSYVFSDPKMAVQFRREFLKFVLDTDAKHPGHLSPIVPSWLVTAGGPKVTRLMTELTRIALLVQIAESKGSQEGLPSFEDDVDRLQEETSAIRDATRNLLIADRVYMGNVEKIADIYKTEISAIESDIEAHQRVLDDLKLSALSPCKILDDWEESIESKIADRERDWKETTDSIKESLGALRITCEEVIRLYGKKQNNVLEYDPSRDKLPDSVVQNGELHLPNLFRAYNHHLKVIPSSSTSEDYDRELDDKKRKLMEIHSRTVAINESIDSLRKDLENNKIAESTPAKCNDWISEYVNVPLIKDLLK